MNILKAILELLGKLFGKKSPKALPEKSPDASEVETPKETPEEPSAEEDTAPKDEENPEEETEYSLEREPAIKTAEEWGLAEVEVVLKEGDSGKEVTAFQKKLERLGYELTRHGADGWLGDETLQEVCDFQDDQREKGNDLKEQEHALKLRGVGRKTYDAIEAEFKKLPILPPLAKPETEPDADAGDETPDNFYKLCPDNGKGVKAKRKRRNDWKGIVGITLHQTACSLGTKATRYKKVSAHVGITRDGKIVQMNGLNWVVYHGNSFNGSRGPGDVGIEIDGHFAGIEGDLKTYWRPRSKPDRQPLSVTPEAVKATLDAIEWIIKEVEKHGGKVKYLHAHRQSSQSRTSDPGSKVWQEIALVAKERFGLSDGGPEFRQGGRPIPKEWDASYKYGYRDNPK